jgi:SAM-dependent methyltransferase
MGRSHSRERPTLAEQADPHELYEAAVQNVAEQCSLIDYLFKQLRGRQAISFREDFCGTASAACEWVRGGAARYAFGVDNDPEVLEWGRKHRVAQLKKKQRKRIFLLESDVTTADLPQVDVISANNFSYWLFRTRAEMLGYFQKVHANLNPDGLFFLDAFGGSEALAEVKEPTEFENFTYVWEQAEFHPISGYMKTYISFEFPDGSTLDKAFTYEWRIWTLPEILALLEEAGFRNMAVWFEYQDDDGTGLSEWYVDMQGSASPTWIANITAEKA